MPDDEPNPREVVDEQARVLYQRRGEALQAGMSWAEADLFAVSEVDVGELRRLIRLGCPQIFLGQILRPLP